MNLSARFLLLLFVFLSTAWGNQYQQYYQQHLQEPLKHQNQQLYHPSQHHAQSIAPTKWAPLPSQSHYPPNSKEPSSSSTGQSAPSSAANVHDQPHKHGSHIHQPHQHHPGVGSKVNPQSEDIFSRPYCAIRNGGKCCPGRDDTCTMPILDSYCYCDVFCNRTVSDCCPDFWNWCIGIAAPSGAMGHGHLPLTKKKDIVSKYWYDMINFPLQSGGYRS